MGVNVNSECHIARVPGGLAVNLETTTVDLASSNRAEGFFPSISRCSKRARKRVGKRVKSASSHKTGDYARRTMNARTGADGEE